MNKTQEKLISAVCFAFIVPIILVAVLGFFLFYPIIWVIMIPDRKRQKQFQRDYEQYMRTINGTSFFCYTNRKKTMPFVISEVLPLLRDDVHVILLEGRSPKTDMDERYISHALYNISGGFPAILIASGGKMLHRSIKVDFYKAVNNQITARAFVDLAHSNFDQLQHEAANNSQKSEFEPSPMSTKP